MGLAEKTSPPAGNIVPISELPAGNTTDVTLLADFDEDGVLAIRIRTGDGKPVPVSVTINHEELL